MQLRLSTRRVQIASWCVGLSQRALDMICEYAPQRSTFGAPLSERQAIQWWVADAATRIHACRLMTYDAAAQLDTGATITTVAAMTKLFATEACAHIVDEATRIYGSYGFAMEYPAQRWFRDARFLLYGGGTSEILKGLIGRAALGKQGRV
jgi:acyl-CoA dehydrogenase